ncbi:hypothetical protein N9N00_00540 [Schleiferiaceae bacterium]|nr:hypothetical protein [Schleiferiaceae bacterium]
MKNAQIFLLSIGICSWVACQTSPTESARYEGRSDSLGSQSNPSGLAWYIDHGFPASFPYMDHEDARFYRGWDGWRDSMWSMPLRDGIRVFFQKPYAHQKGDTAVVEEWVGEYLTGQKFWFRYPENRFDSVYATLRVHENVRENFDPARSYGGRDLGYSAANWEAYERQMFHWHGWSEEVFLEDSAGFYRIYFENEWDGFWEQRRQELMGWRDTMVDFSGEADNVATVSVDGKPCTHMNVAGLLTFYTLDGFGKPIPHYVKVWFSYGC